jgi:hypothetical protein
VVVRNGCTGTESAVNPEQLFRLAASDSPQSGSVTQPWAGSFRLCARLTWFAVHWLRDAGRTKMLYARVRNLSNIITVHRKIVVSLINYSIPAILKYLNGIKYNFVLT